MHTPQRDLPGGGIAARPRRLSLLALLLLLPAPTLGTASALFFWPDTALGKAIFAGTKLWIVVMPVLWMLLVDRQPVSWSPARKGGFGVAALSGIGIGLVILGAYSVFLRTGLIEPGMVAERASKTGLDRLPAYLGGAVYWITLNSLMEEYVWRWFVFRKFEDLRPGALAVVATSLAFTAHHVVALAAQFHWPLVLLGSMGVFIGGLTWSGLYLRYRSVWPCYLSHALVDAPIFWIGYDLIFRRAG